MALSPLRALPFLRAVNRLRDGPNKATGSGYKSRSGIRKSYKGAATVKHFRILDFSPEFFLQFGVGNLNHGGTAVGTAVGQITSEQITN
jgi:hypothetical protein